MKKQSEKAILLKAATILERRGLAHGQFGKCKTGPINMLAAIALAKGRTWNFIGDPEYPLLSGITEDDMERWAGMACMRDSEVAQHYNDLYTTSTVAGRLRAAARGEIGAW